MKKKRVTKRDVTTTDLQYNLSFEQAYDYFFNTKKLEGMRDRTLTTYQEHFNFFNKWIQDNYPEMKPNDLTANVVREYLLYMKEDHFNYKTKEYGLSDMTTNARLRFLKTFYNFLFKEDLVNTNQVNQVKFIKMDERPFDPLTDDEMKRLMNAPNLEHFPQFRDFVLMNLLYDSAMRITEAINITVDNLDLKARRIILPADTTKGRKMRVIPLSNHVVKLLMELIAENETHFDDRHLFLNWYGEPMSEDTFRRSLLRYVEKAGITKHFSCHDFRRQSITEMLKNGASLFTVMSIAGHSQISTTKKYVHFDQETIKNQHDLYSPVVKMRSKFKRR